MCVSTWFHKPPKGRFGGLWSPAPPLFHWSLGCGADELLQLAALEHFHHDVGAANELAVDVQLRDRRPVAVRLDALPDVRILEHVDRLEGHGQMLKDRDRPAREAALREKLGALHEKDHLIAADDLVDPLSGVSHSSSPLAPPSEAAAHAILRPSFRPARHRPSGAAERA